jgi:ATP/ADP translocase
MDIFALFYLTPVIFWLWVGFFAILFTLFAVPVLFPDESAKHKSSDTEKKPLIQNKRRKKDAGVNKQRVVESPELQYL